MTHKHRGPIVTYRHSRRRSRVIPGTSSARRYLETNASFWLCWRELRQQTRDSYVNQSLCVNYYTLWLSSPTKTTPNTTNNIQWRKIAVNLLPSLVIPTYDGQHFVTCQHQMWRIFKQARPGHVRRHCEARVISGTDEYRATAGDHTLRLRTQTRLYCECYWWINSQQTLDVSQSDSLVAYSDLVYVHRTLSEWNNRHTTAMFRSVPTGISMPQLVIPVWWLFRSSTRTILYNYYLLLSPILQKMVP